MNTNYPRKQVEAAQSINSQPTSRHSLNFSLSCQQQFSISIQLWANQTPHKNRPILLLNYTSPYKERCLNFLP